MFYFVNFFYLFLIDLCSKSYCQDGIQVFFGTEFQQYNYGLYGHYDLQSDYVNDRPYFRMYDKGIWWDKIDSWWIGHYSQAGQSSGYAYYSKDAFCPHQLNEWKWKGYNSDHNWIDAGKHLGVTCKYCDCCSFNSIHIYSNSTFHILCNST